MKKLISLALVILLMFTLAACGSEPNNPEPPVNPDPEVDPYEITYTSAQTWTNSIGTTWVQTIIEVTNTGTSALYLSSGAYDLEKPDGSLVASSSLVSVYPTVINPGEKAYYYEETTLDSGEPGEQLTVVPRIDAEEAKVETIRFALSDITLSDGKYGGVDVLGRIENTSTEVQNMVYIAVVLFDSNDKPIGLIFTILSDEIAVGTKVGFEASSLALPENVTTETIARYEAFAYPLQMQF